MTLQELFKYCPSVNINANVNINHLEYDSRKIKAGDLFIALKGSQVDSHQFVPELLKKGAYAVVSKGSFPEQNGLIFVENTRETLALLSKSYFGAPDEDLFIAGITGTNGKTTSTYMIKSILEDAGIKTGIIGTIQHMIGSKVIEAKNTTPESYDIYSMLSEMKKEGCKALAIEISSHALSMYRANGLALNVALFTNLTQDHLDFHKDFDHYLAAKLKIFKLLQSSTKDNKMALFNSDCPYADKIESFLKDIELPYQSYGLKKSMDWNAIPHKSNIFHNKFQIQGPNKLNIEVDTPMLGEFNIYNALGAAASSNIAEIQGKNIQNGLKNVHVRGRFETVPNHLDIAVVVDYAHTPDALENVIRCGINLNPKRIITVFGAGGDRDKQKRPLMGKVSKKLSTFTIITSDNPRSENPEDIIRDIETVFDSNDNYITEVDREKAIEKAIKMAQNGDLIILAGKGHEDYQVFKSETIHFSDKETAEKYLREKEAHEKG